ncbi:MAG: hypothetical protein M1829_000331 [Trizodia sp. TS-e1964]|nr:MAG: hypothetical protein M1829_000331 [Trizodia sp. TS-e1964]
MMHLASRQLGLLALSLLSSSLVGGHPLALPSTDFISPDSRTISSHHMLQARSPFDFQEISMEEAMAWITAQQGEADIGVQIPWPKSGEGRERDLAIWADMDLSGIWTTHTGYTADRFSVYSRKSWARGLGRIEDPLAAERVIRDTPIKARPYEDKLKTTERWIDQAKESLLAQKLWSNDRWTPGGIGYQEGDFI